MKLRILSVLFLFAINLQAREKVTDLFFYPEANQSFGFTGLNISHSELTVTGVNKVVFSSDKTRLSQSFGLGFQSGFAAKIELDYIMSGSSETKVNSTATSSDYVKKIQAPSLEFGKRFQLDGSALKFVDASLMITPKGASDDADSSDYMGVQLTSGVTLSETLKATGSLGYISYNSTDTVEAYNATGLLLSLQNDLNESSFLIGSIIYVIETDSKFKASTVVVKYDPNTTLKVGYGYTKVGSNMDLLFSYNFSSNSAKYAVSSTNYPGSGNVNSFNFGVGYKF